MSAKDILLLEKLMVLGTDFSDKLGKIMLVFKAFELILSIIYFEFESEYPLIIEFIFIFEPFVIAFNPILTFRILFG